MGFMLKRAARAPSPDSKIVSVVANPFRAIWGQHWSNGVRDAKHGLFLSSVDRAVDESNLGAGLVFQQGLRDSVASGERSADSQLVGSALL